MGLSLDSWSCQYGNFRSLLFASSLVVLECFLSPFLLATCLGGTKGAVTEINSATFKTLHGVGPWAIRSILGLEFQDLVKKIEMDEKVGQSNNQWGWNGFQW